MAEAMFSTRSSPIPTHEQNISMLLDKLKELKMSTGNSTDASVFGKVEREYSY